MHETVVAESILKTILENARQTGAKPVSAIISCGQFNVLNDEVMSFAFETAAAGTAGYQYGPYMSKIPENPVSGKSSVRVFADNEAMIGAASGVDGWLYKPITLEFRADCTGSDQEGKDYFDY